MPDVIETPAHGRRTTDAIVGALAIVGAFRVLGRAVRFLTHVVAPRFFTHYEHFPALADAPKRTLDEHGRPGNPVNLALVGTADDLASAFVAAGWTRAQDPNRHDDVALVKSILLKRPDDDAPVSPLYLFGRKQDVAYERERGRSAGKRDHVRLWQSDLRFPGDERPVWLGSATLDTRSGVVLRRMMPTHHIGPDIDEERDSLVDDLVAAQRVAERFDVTGLGLRVGSRNSSGDRFDTDGELMVAVLTRGNERVTTPRFLPNPAPVAAKNRVWYAVHRDRDVPGRETSHDVEARRSEAQPGSG